MSDASQIANTFSNPDIAVPEFTKAQWEYITDNNGGAYTNQLNFLTSQIRNKFTDMHNGIFAIPLAISSSDTTRPYFLHGSILSTANRNQGVAGNPGANFAWKVSVLGFIANILLSTDNSYTITTEQQMYHINMIRLLVEHDYVWIEQEGPFIGYYPVRNILSTVVIKSRLSSLRACQTDYLNELLTLTDGYVRDCCDFYRINIPTESMALKAITMTPNISSQ